MVVLWSGERHLGVFYWPRGGMVGPARFELAINGGRPGRRSSGAAGGAVRKDTEDKKWDFGGEQGQHGKGPRRARGGEGGGGDVLCAAVVGERMKKTGGGGRRWIGR